jgi:hypothetical protein
MLDRLSPVFRGICIALGALVLFQLTSIARRKNPLDGFTPPALVSAKSELPAEAKPTPTNSSAASGPGIPGSAHFPRMGGPNTAADLPAPVKARVDRIIESEILGPVNRPLPMALLGIAGRDVFLRAPNGQTGIIREGEELGGVKLLKIGTNRVLIEHEQQQKELIVFEGFGSETLLPKGKESPH